MDKKSDDVAEEAFLDVFPEAFQFIEREIGYILRFTVFLELSLDGAIASYLAADRQSFNMLLADVLPYLALEIRVKLMKDILEALGRTQEFPTLIEDIRAMIRLRHTLAHSTIVHAIRPEYREGDIPLMTSGRGGSKFFTIRQEEVLSTLQAGKRASNWIAKFQRDTIVSKGILPHP